MPSNNLIFCHPLLLLPSFFPRIRVFSSELALHIRWPKYWSFSFSIGPINKYSGLIFYRTEFILDSSMTYVLTRKGNLGTDSPKSQTPLSNQASMQARHIGRQWICRQKTAESTRETWDGSFLHSIKGTNSTHTLILNFPSPELRDNTFLLFKLPSLVLCY